MERKLYEMILSEEVDDLGVNVFSLVEEPANETELVFMSAEKEPIKLAADEVKQMIYAAALIPNQRILRSSKEKGVYDIMFREETIELASQKAIANGLQNISFDHSGENVNGINVVESWLVSDPEKDKATALGFDLPKGTWMLGFKIADKSNWEAVKNSKINGVSIEGLFAREEVKLELTPSELYNKYLTR